MDSTKEIQGVLNVTMRLVAASSADGTSRYFNRFASNYNFLLPNRNRVCTRFPSMWRNGKNGGGSDDSKVRRRLECDPRTIYGGAIRAAGPNEDARNYIRT